jgi:ferric-dicitrate binding protein FerR (iron transport regulator)
MNEFDRQPWIDDARALLDESAQAIDAASLSRLNRARQAALAQRRPRRRAAWWLPAAGLACSGALLLAIVVWAPLRSTHPVDAAPGTSAAATLPAEGDAISGDDSIEFYQDLEFYAWLDAQEQDGDG